jgi:hypothetical protein
MTTALFKFLFFLTIIITPIAYHSTVQSASADTTDLQTYGQDSPPFTPSPDPQGRFFYTRGGFKVPYPTSKSLTTNEDFTLSVQAVRPRVLSLFPPTLTYSWWTSDNQMNWRPISNNKTGNLKVNTSRKGIKYYQVKAVYKNFVGFTIHGPYYSKIIKVSINEKPIDTENLSIETSSPYLLNIGGSLLDNAIYATGSRNPEEATDPIIWSTSDDNIAHINSNGEITPVGAEHSGNILIKALVKNSINKKTKIAQKEIRVGGGLDDIDAKLGDNVTFKIQGLSDNKRDDADDVSIDWFKQESDHDNWIKLPHNNKTELTLNNLESNLDGSMYHAVFSYTNESNKRESFKTNDAQLTISNSIIGIDNQIQNTSHKDDPLDTKTNLANVARDDDLTYRLHLSNVNKTNLKDQTLVIPLPLQVNITKLKINDEQNIEYKLQTESFKKKNLIIDLTKFKDKEDLNVELNLKVGQISNNFEFESNPVIYGTYLEDKNDNSYHNYGSTISFHFITNMFFPSIHDITFNPIQTYAPNSLIYRLNDTNAPNNIIDFDDQRRNFNPVKIMVAQSHALYDQKSKAYLPAVLQIHNLTNNTVTNVSDHPAFVAISTRDQKLHYLNWNKNEGLLLKLKPGSISPGNYETTLNWTFIEST